MDGTRVEGQGAPVTTGLATNAELNAARPDFAAAPNTPLDMAGVKPFDPTEFGAPKPVSSPDSALHATAPEDPNTILGRDAIEDADRNREYEQIFANADLALNKTKERMRGILSHVANPTTRDAIQEGFLAEPPTKPDIGRQLADSFQREFNKIVAESSNLGERTAQVDLDSQIHAATTVPELDKSLAAATAAVNEGPAAHVPTAEVIASTMDTHTADQMPQINTALNTATQGINAGPAAHVPTAETIGASMNAGMSEQMKQINDALASATTNVSQMPAPTPVAPTPTATAA